MTNPRKMKLQLLGLIGLALMLALAPRLQAASRDTLLTSNKMMSMDFVDADLKQVLRLIAKQNNLNIIASDQITGTVTVSFEEVSLKGALEAILAANGYDYVLYDNIIVVKRRDESMIGDVETRVYNLKYINASDAITALENVLSDNGQVKTFSRNFPDASGQTAGATTAGRENQGNSSVLVVTDDPNNFPSIENVINQLDNPEPQVMIAVKFVETRLDHNDALGINWTAKARISGGPQPNLGYGGSATGGTGYTGSSGSNYSSRTTGFPLFGKFKNLDLAILSLQEFQAVLEMLFTNGDSRLLSDPRIATINNQPAEINVSTTIPILVPQENVGGVTGGLGGAFLQNTFEEKEISISLNVLPRVNTDRLITMVVKPLVEAITGYAGPDQDRPIVASRSAQTQVMVKDGETIAIGGLIKEDKFETFKKVPILGDIPLIGMLFRHKSEQTEKTDLIIFITPHIVGPTSPADLSLKK